MNLTSVFIALEGKHPFLIHEDDLAHPHLFAAGKDVQFSLIKYFNQCLLNQLQRFVSDSIF